MGEQIVSKYAPLEAYLKSAGFETIFITFSEIETIIGDRLPPSARKHRPWWSNNTSNSAMTRSWTAAGFKTTQVNINNESLVFVKTGVGNALANPSKMSLPSGRDIHPAFGCLRDTVTMPGDADLTVPASDDWADLAMNAKLYNEE